jgi:glycosyltransferase involved in cell wall biosynthesis
MEPPKVILVGQTPPPVHGQALAIERLVRAGFRRVEVHHVRMDFSSQMTEVGRFRLRKLWRLGRLVWRVLAARFRSGARTLYYPPAGPQTAPVVRDILFLNAVRPFFPVLVLDYHAAGLPDMESQLPALFRPLFRRAYEDATVAIHKYPPEWNTRNLPAGRDIVVPYGIEDVYPHYQTVKGKNHCLRLLFVGILSDGKGIWTLLDAVAELARRGVDVQAGFMGEFTSAPSEADFDECVRQAGLSDRVRLMGRLMGAAKWREFSKADVFCFPSHYENEALPLVVIEAMQFALPVVASAWRGIPYLVQDGVTGFLVPPRDPVAVADRVQRLEGDATLRARMGAAGRTAYLARFTIDAHLAAMEEALLTAGSS